MLSFESPQLVLTAKRRRLVLRINHILVICLMLGTTPACKQTDQAASEVKFGFKAGIYGDGIEGSAYHLTPNQSVAFCNRGVDSTKIKLLKDATNYWLEPLGRNGHIRLIDDCAGDLVLNIAPDQTTHFAQVFQDGPRNYRVGVGPNFAGHYTARHEMGHVMGFCDLYNPVSCTQNSNDPSPSLMGSGDLNGGELSAGDIKGIYELVAHPRLAASTAAWQKFLGSNAKSPGQQDSTNVSAADAKQPIPTADAIGSGDDAISALARTSDECLCTRAQEGGCGVTKRGVWLATKWYVPLNGSLCDAAFCSTYFAPELQQSCGGMVGTHPMFN